MMKFCLEGQIRSCPSLKDQSEILHKVRSGQRSSKFYVRRQERRSIEPVEDKLKIIKRQQRTKMLKFAPVPQEGTRAIFVVDDFLAKFQPISRHEWMKGGIANPLDIIFEGDEVKWGPQEQNRSCPSSRDQGDITSKGHLFARQVTQVWKS